MVDRAVVLASASWHLPLILALWAGRRQGDLLRLTWAAYDGSTVRLKQGTTSARVVVPVRAALEAVPWFSPVILLGSEGACGLPGPTFHDFGGAAVSRLALAGCSEAEIATPTGHTLEKVRSSLDAHSFDRDPALAFEAIGRLEMGTHVPYRSPDRSQSRTQKFMLDSSTLRAVVTSS